MNSKRIAAARSRVYIIATAVAALLGTASATGLIPEYTAAEAKKHIGERTTIVGKVDCIDHGRRHTDVLIGGCDLRKALLWIVVPLDASGPELDPETVRGVQIAVTGKIELAGGTPQITIKSTTQIVPRTALRTNYIGRAYDKQQQGDIDGAIADLERAIEHQPDRRDEACEHLAGVKEKRGDWAGALAAYDRLVSFNPNNAGSYYARATAKKQHGDFEAAMTDFTKAAELRRSGVSFVEIGNFRKAQGDAAGAMAEYDRAIAILDKQISGREPPIDRLDLLYYQRGYTKELKGALDGAVSDYNQAITIKPTYEAGAFSRRGDIKKSRGDLWGAIADYEHAVQYAQLDEDKEKLKKAKAEANRKHEQSSNEGEATPESIAEAFVQAYSGADVDALAGLYADRIDYTSSGVISNAAVRAQVEKYFARWPVRRWSLVGPVNTVSLETKKKIIFSASYDVSNPQTNKHTSGTAKETLIMATDASGAIKIVSQKEQTNKRGSSQPGEETSGDSITTSPADAQVTEKLKSPDGKYSVEVVRGRFSDDSLVISKGGETIAKVPTPVGPEGSFFQTLWSPEGKYVAINKQRSSRPGGDSMWIVALATGKVLRKPDDALWNEVEEREGAYIDEKHLSETGGKEFLTLIATGWEKGRLRFRLEAGFSAVEERYFFDGTVEPLNLRTINDWKVSTTKSNGDQPADSAIKQKLLGYWKFPKAVCYIAADGKMWVGPRKDQTDTSRWNVKDGKFYWDSVPYTIVTLTDSKFVFRESFGQETTFTLVRSTKEEVGPE